MAQLAAARFRSEHVGLAQVLGFAAGRLFGFEHKMPPLVAIDIKFRRRAVGMLIVETALEDIVISRIGFLAHARFRHSEGRAEPRDEELVIGAFGATRRGRLGDQIVEVNHVISKLPQYFGQFCARTLGAMLTVQLARQQCTAAS